MKGGGGINFWICALEGELKVCRGKWRRQRTAKSDPSYVQRVPRFINHVDLLGREIEAHEARSDSVMGPWPMFVLFLVNSSSDWRGPTSGGAHKSIGGGVRRGGVSEEEDFTLGEDDVGDYGGESSQGEADQGGGIGEEGDYQGSDYDGDFYNYVEGGDSVGYDDDGDSPGGSDEGSETSEEGEGISEEGDYVENVDHGEDYGLGVDYGFVEDYGLGEDHEEDYVKVGDSLAGDDQESNVGDADGKKTREPKYSPFLKLHWSIFTSHATFFHHQSHFCILFFRWK